MQRPPATAMVKVAFVDLPECGERLDEKRLEHLERLRRALESCNDFGWAPPTNWVDGAIRSGETTPSGRRLEMFALYTYGGENCFADLADREVELPPDEIDAVDFFLRQHRCVVDTMWANYRRPRGGRRVFGLDGEAWFEDTGRGGMGLADDPPLLKIIDDNIGPYIIRLAALG